MLLGEFTFTPAGATYLGEPVTCKVSEYRKTFEVNCRCNVEQPAIRCSGC